MCTHALNTVNRRGVSAFGRTSNPNMGATRTGVRGRRKNATTEVRLSGCWTHQFLKSTYRLDAISALKPITDHCAK